MSSEDYGKVRILCYYVFFDTVACFRAVCNLRSFFECFTTFITCDHITVFCCFLLCFTYLKSFKVFVLCQFDGLNFHLVFVCCHFCPSCFGFVYLFLYPSRFIRNAACRQLFLYLSVFVLLVTN